ncbi:MAG: hypothetical protein EOP62_18795 [Sphingomonadales bacterium]|nr:MAG: hypothetical protein EOP62_18795 [Sphingomonadales bacterium]
MNQYFKYAGVALVAVIATLGVSKAVHVSMDKGIGHFGNADANNDGEITTAEWTAAATTRFQSLDTNKDGKLVVGEIPRGGERGGRHRRGPGGPDEDWGQPAPPPPFATENMADGNVN